MKFETMAVHAGGRPEDQFGDVAAPIRLSTTFARDAEGTPLGGHTYIRESNPTQSALEKALAALEGGEDALVFGSGMAAGVTLMQALPSGSHVVLPRDAYYAFRAAGREFLPRWGLTATETDTTDPAQLQLAMRPETRLVFLESPSNPLLAITDLAAAAAIAHRQGASVMVDNTFATPALQHPLALGADVVLHSTTKALGGHSDAQGGALVFARRDDLLERARHARHLLGPVASPFNSWLILRGIRTLACRMAAQSKTALEVAQALARHPEVARVHYPGLPTHARHDVARQQMSAFGSMLSFHVRGGEEAALRAVGRARLFVRATSLGGVESLIEHRASSEGKGSTTPTDLVRLSIGLEHAEDLVGDLGQALA